MRDAHYQYLKTRQKKQYGSTMTKLMPTGCIKKHSLSWLKFSLLLKTIDLDNKIGRLFVVDIEFDEKRATECEYMHN